jgi:hypothetical protein
MPSVQDKQVRFNAWNATFNIAIPFGRGQFTALIADGVLGPRSTAAFAAMTAKKPAWLLETPPPTITAVDSLSEVSAPLLSLVTSAIGVKPVWWGRYISVFKAADVCAISSAEGAVLADASIPVQPISANAARLGLLSKGAATGASEAVRDLQLLQQVTKNAPRMTKRVFLDIEENTSLSPAFYVAWSTAMAKAGWEPAVYMPNRLHPGQWIALRTAIGMGAVCAGIWSAWYAFQTQAALDAGSSHYMAVPWDACFAGNDDSHDCAWQYMGALDGDKWDATVFKPGVQAWW